MAERKERTIDWRSLFVEDELREGEKLYREGDVGKLFIDPRNSFCSAVVQAGAYTTRAVKIYGAPQSYSSDWEYATFSCSCNRYRWSGSCAHIVAVMTAWEHEHGPWVFRETPEEAEERERQEARKREKLAREAERAAKKQQPVDLEAFVFRMTGAGSDGRLKAGTYFDLGLALHGKKSTQYDIEQAEKLLGQDLLRVEKHSILRREELTQSLFFSCRTHDDYRSCHTSCSLLEDRVENVSCNCTEWFRTHSCPHIPALFVKLQQYIVDEDPGEITGPGAYRFLDAFRSSGSTGPRTEAPAVHKENSIIIKPRLVLDEGKLYLSYKIGHGRGRLFVLRSVKAFVQAMEEDGRIELGKSDHLDFARMAVREDSEKWARLLIRRFADVSNANEHISERAWYSSQALTARSQDLLDGNLLDDFYELAEHSSVELQNKDGDGAGEIRVAHEALQLRLLLEPILNREGKLYGIKLSGSLPTLIEGGMHRYILDSRHLSRLSPEELAMLRPFQAVNEGLGSFMLSFGPERLQEFCFRVLPRLQESPAILLENRIGEDVYALLPPEPVFEFRIDLEGGVLSLDESVHYGNRTYRLPADREASADEMQTDLPNEIQTNLPNDNRTDSPEAAETDGGSGLKELIPQRDRLQEERVEQLIRSWFPELGTDGRYLLPCSDDVLFRMMNEIVPALSEYGTVLGSDAFSRIQIRNAPSVRVGVSIDSGLMELSFISKEIDAKELYRLLDSYRRKKRYHRLNDGDFVALAESPELESLDRFVTDLGISEEELESGEVKLPVYRALYLNRMMEEHEALASERDRTFRALVRSFRTIGDAEFEAPEGMKEVLRPYQLYGYKWLRTLYASGFGGILADEMGLGKTLQMIALFEAVLRDKAEAGEKTALVVCPASLVYNWQEEIHRFAPALTVTAVSGTAAARSAILQEAHPADVLVTSYDLLKKDILLYRDLHFDIAVLDEAQYIKNQKAAAAKAVKALSASHRFALTGTPIENRLAELHSIFDFLMPGYLYRYDDFQQRFEIPIVKVHEREASERLRKMVGPFILRRLKSDVLKDLPAKLEELRYAKLEGEQRKLYDAQVAHMKEMLSSSGRSGEDRIRIFAELTRIREICCDPALLFEDYSGESAKREACLELIRSAIDGGHRMLVFSQFTSMIALLQQDLDEEGIRYYTITGQTPKEERLKLVHRFNDSDEVPVFLISLKAGGTGLNLVGADMVIHYDPWWNLAVQNQATDRAHRIGQTREVSVFKLIGKDTIEEKILALQDAKKELADAILSGENSSIMSLTPEELADLLN